MELLKILEIKTNEETVSCLWKVILKNFERNVMKRAETCNINCVAYER